MLKFEFVQPGEFEEPCYEATYEGDCLGYMVFGNNWKYEDGGSFRIPSNGLRSLAEKLEQLNQSTKSQRILGVF